MRMVAILSALAVVGQGVAEAKPLTCPASSASASLPAADTASLTESLDLVDRAAALSRLVAVLRDRGMASSAIVDSLIAAYCPTVAAKASLSDQQKTAIVRSFASQAVRSAYQFDSADEIILDVALAPSVARDVNMRAARDKATPEQWAADAVTNAVKTPR